MEGCSFSDNLISNNATKFITNLEISNRQEWFTSNICGIAFSSESLILDYENSNNYATSIRTEIF